MANNCPLQGHDGADRKCHYVASAAAETRLILDSFSAAVTAAPTATEAEAAERHTDGEKDPDGDTRDESCRLAYQL